MLAGTRERRVAARETNASMPTGGSMPSAVDRVQKKVPASARTDRRALALPAIVEPARKRARFAARSRSALEARLVDDFAQLYRDVRELARRGVRRGGALLGELGGARDVGDVAGDIAGSRRDLGDVL